MNLKAFFCGMALVALCAFAAAVQPASGPDTDAGYSPLPPRLSYLPFTIPRLPPGIDGVHAIKESYVNIEMHDYAGAGVIIEKSIILTNAHVVLDDDGDPRQKRYSVSLYDGERVRGYYLAHSKTYDIAILSVPEDFGTPVSLASQEVSVGQDVVAVGNPNSGRWVAKGIVLALDLQVRHDFVPDRSDIAVRMFVMNAAIVPGYSGGPVVHPVTGEVYGISVGLARRYIDPVTGKWVTPPTRVGVAMHIQDILTELEKLRATPPLI